MSDVMNNVESAAIEQLEKMILQVIVNAERQSLADIRMLTENSETVINGFLDNIRNKFAVLTGKEPSKESAIVNFETLSLVQEDELDVMVALEGMVNAARNEHLAVTISFNTRLSYLLPGKDVDESISPLDPEQISNAFQEALRPLALPAATVLGVYRLFNAEVLKKLGDLLGTVNKVLIDANVVPELQIEAQKSKSGGGRRTVERVDPRGFGSVEEEVEHEPHDSQEESTSQMFSVMQNLLHPSEDEPAQDTTGLIPAKPGDEPPPGHYMVPASMVPNLTAADSETMQPFLPADGQTVEMVDQATLMKILTDLQNKVSSAPADSNLTDDSGKLDVSQSLGELLEATQEEDGVVTAIDRQSSDIINLVTLLYDAIWQDVSVPIPIKELIGRTQVTIIKVALADVEFFNNENHPARAILNEYASAGIGWTEVDKLHEDPLYKKISDQVARIQAEYDGENSLFEEMLGDFKEFIAQKAAKTEHLEQRLLKEDERKERLDEIHELVNQKIDERVLGRELDPFVEALLHGPFHKFMVMLVLKEGPGSNAWKQAINTIDVLLWSVQQHEHTGDQKRLETINPRLLNNLRKAFRIASESAEEIDELIRQLERTQKDSFNAVAANPDNKESESKEAQAANKPSAKPETLDNIEKVESDTPVRFLPASDSGDGLTSETDGRGAKQDGGTQQTSESEITPASDDSEVVSSTSYASDNQTETDQDSASQAELGEGTASIDSPSSTEGAQEKETESVTDAETEAEDELSPDDPHMLEVDRLSVGIWVEFQGEDDLTTRCKLAAKINAIDKYIFVNRQGVKVVEKTKMGLAKELRDGTVNFINDGALFSRALESVIGNLRENQHEQQTGSAYNPQTSAAPESVERS